MKKILMFIAPVIVYEVVRECAGLIPGLPGELQLFIGGATALIVMLFWYLRDPLTRPNFRYLNKHSMPGSTPAPRSRRFAHMILPGILAAIMGLSADLFFSFFMTLISFGRQLAYTEVSRTLFTGTLLIQLLSIGLLIPAAEEITFRGLMYPHGQALWGSPLLSAIFTSIVFGAFHGNISQMIAGFVSGLILCMIYEKSRRIIIPILYHISFNMLSVILTACGLYINSIYVIIFVTALSGLVLVCSVLSFKHLFKTT